MDDYLNHRASMEAAEDRAIARRVAFRAALRAYTAEQLDQIADERVRGSRRLTERARLARAERKRRAREETSWIIHRDLIGTRAGMTQLGDTATYVTPHAAGMAEGYDAGMAYTDETFGRIRLHRSILMQGVRLALTGNLDGADELLGRCTDPILGR